MARRYQGWTEQAVTHRKGVHERDFQRTVIEAAQALGWTHIYHTYDSRRSPQGFPDLVLLRPPQILFLELKMPGRRLTPAQREWLQALQACGLKAYVAWPKDFDRLIELLRSREP